MRLMLVGGSVLFALIVVGVVLSMNRGEKRVVTATVPTGAPAPKGTLPMAERNEGELLAVAEALARKFLEATSVDELLPLVRNPAVTEPRMRDFYPNGTIEAPGLAKFNSGGSLSISGKLVSLAVRTRDQQEKSLAFIETPQGMKVDWESWVGWSDISWEKFLSTKPVDGHVFRVTVSNVEYYNFGFADESKWRSYRLISPVGETSIYGYVGRGSVLEQQIHPDAENQNLALMLSLKFPAGADSGSQVEVERLVADGWVEGADSP